MWNRLTRVAPPAMPILSIDEVRHHLRIAHSDDDAYIAGLIAVATASIDGPNGAGVPLLTQSWRLTLDDLPRTITLPLRPVQSVSEVTVDGTVLDPSLYAVDADVGTIRIHVLPRCGATTKVTCTAGYGDDPADVPADLGHAALLMIGHFYERREATSNTVVNTVPMAVESILSRYRAHGIG